MRVAGVTAVAWVWAIAVRMLAQFVMSVRLPIAVKASAEPLMRTIPVNVTQNVWSEAIVVVTLASFAELVMTPSITVPLRMHVIPVLWM